MPAGQCRSAQCEPSRLVLAGPPLCEAPSLAQNVSASRCALQSSKTPILLFPVWQHPWAALSNPAGMFLALAACQSQVFNSADHATCEVAQHAGQPQHVQVARQHWQADRGSYPAAHHAPSQQSGLTLPAVCPRICAGTQQQLQPDRGPGLLPIVVACMTSPGCSQDV